MFPRKVQANFVSSQAIKDFDYFVLVPCELPFSLLQTKRVKCIFAFTFYTPLIISR